MILIKKGHLNQIVVTLTEKVSLANPKYLFYLTNDTSKKSYAFISEDLSCAKKRYNRFEITEGTPQDPLNGVISLPLEGFYHYKIYEQGSSINLDPNLTEKLLESGKLRVESAEPIYTTPSIDTEITVYEPS